MHSQASLPDAAVDIALSESSENWGAKQKIYIKMNFYLNSLIKNSKNSGATSVMGALRKIPRCRVGFFEVAFGLACAVDCSGQV